MYIDVDSIPTLPAIAIEAIRLMEGKHSNFKSVADLLRNDQVLAGRIIHYVNSAYTGARTEISTISRAIALLGFNTVRSIILSASVFDCFSSSVPKKKANLVNFWLHSIGVAVTTEALAKKLGFPNPEEAYIAGLIHDMGKLVSYIQNPEKFEEVCVELEKGGNYSTKNLLPLDVENQILGTNHTEIGKIIAKQWKFPKLLARAMWMHHQPVYETIKPDNDNICQLIRFADTLCVTHNIGSSYFLSTNAYDHQHYHYALENLIFYHNFSSTEIEDMMGDVLTKVKNVANILGFCDEEIYRNLVSSANVSLGSMSRNLEQKNQELTATNKVLDATYKMSHKLRSGLSLTETIQEIILAAKDAFGVKRCLCMIRNDLTHEYVGQVFSEESFEEFSVPISNIEIKTKLRESDSDIEEEALKRLKRANRDFSKGTILESGVADIVSGSQFLATFFLADKNAHGRPERIIGELMIDFQDTLNLENKLDELNRNFEILTAAAGSAIECILMEKDLDHQAKKMAAASRKMEESQRQLFHSHRLATVGSLAAGAAHEINNPLTIISLHLQMLERMLEKRENTSELMERLKVISNQEQRISKIISELMGFARPSQPKLSASDVNEIMNRVLKVIGDRVSMGKIIVKNEINENLPRVKVDPLQIEQVFMNLLINANHSMAEGGTIILKAENKNSNIVTVQVTDTGTGIAKKNLGKVFDPFFTTKKEGEGTGLGLAICHSIVEHNGGTLLFDSIEGQGTTFYVNLPIDKVSRLKAMKKVIDQKQKKTESIPENYRILIVDDERLLNETVQECLRVAGYEVDGAYDGVEGIGMLNYKKYNLILLDIRMPRKDGLDVLEFVKEEYPEIHVIIITGLASVKEIKETVKMGAFAVIKKPFKIESVISKIDEALRDKTSIDLSKKTKFSKE